MSLQVILNKFGKKRTSRFVLIGDFAPVLLDSLLDCIL